MLMKEWQETSESAEAPFCAALLCRALLCRAPRGSRPKNSSPRQTLDDNVAPRSCLACCARANPKRVADQGREIIRLRFLHVTLRFRQGGDRGARNALLPQPTLSVAPSCESSFRAKCLSAIPCQDGLRRAALETSGLRGETLRLRLSLLPGLRPQARRVRVTQPGDESLDYPPPSPSEL